MSQRPPTVSGILAGAPAVTPTGSVPVIPRRTATRSDAGFTRRRVDHDTDWMDHANCLGVDPDLFFPQRGESTKEAEAVCAACLVRDECLAYALRHNEKFGVWGGKSDRERRQIRRARRRGSAA